MTFNRLRIWLQKPMAQKLISMRGHTLRTLTALVVPPLVALVRPFLRSSLGRQVIYKASPRNSLLVARAGAMHYVVNSSDTCIGYTTYRRGVAYDSEKIKSTFSLLPGPQVTCLIDIGANIGTIGLSAVADNLVSRCVAFEPEPRNFQLLSANIILNGLSNRVIAHNVALADGSSSELQFELADKNYGDHRVRVTSQEGSFNEASREVITVRAAKLDDFFVDADLSGALIWMDTQGFEGYVLAGSARLIERGVPIVTEFWPYGLNRAHCYESFVAVLTGGAYSTIIDLENPGEKMPCTRETFVRLSQSLALDWRYTDLLIY